MQPRRVAAWLIPNIHAASPAVLRNGYLTAQPIGQANVPVTIRGRGGDGPHPSWALGYDDTLGRLAFHDPVAEPGATGPLAYTVIGWYTHSRLDPLTPPEGTPATPTWLADTLRSLEWSVNLPPGTEPPTGSVYHGAALAIAWPGRSWPGDDGGRLSAEKGGAPSLEDLRLALADTLSAATAALLDEQAPSGLAALSEAVLAGQMPELAQPDGTSRLDETRHQSRFRASASRDATTEVLWEEDQGLPQQVPSTPPPHVMRAVEEEAPRAVQAGLTTLDAAVRASRAGPSAAAAASGPGTLTEVSYPQPRQWQAGDPVLVLAGLGRALRHGGDGRFDPQGRLNCRVSGQEVTGTAPPLLPPWTAAADVPAEVGKLVAELALIDPGSVADLAAAGSSSGPAADRAAWWDTWSGDWRTAPVDTGWLGMLPSPVGVTRPSRPWNPLRLDWEAVVTRTPAGPSHWTLGELDFEPVVPFVLPAGTEATVTGLGWLSPAPANLLAGAAGDGQDTRADLAARDLVAAAMEGFFDAIRGVPRGVWVAWWGIEDDPARNVLAAEAYPAVGHVAGLWRLGRVRAVDTFGQVVMVHDPGGIGPVAAAPAMPAELAVPGIERVALRPRFTAPAKLEARLLDPQGDREAGPGRNPLCGFLLPSPLDLSLEMADAEGAVLARLRSDPRTAATILEEVPGMAASPKQENLEDTAAARAAALLGAAGAPLSGALLTIAGALVGADRMAGALPGGTAMAGKAAGALGTLMRMIDTTRAAVDVTGRIGDDQMALLLGHPVSVIRAGVTLDVDDPQSRDANAAVATPCRIGSVSSLQDGVLAWFAEDRPEQVHPVHAAVAALARPLAADPAITGPLTGPFIGDPLLWLRPGETRRLVLITAPGTDVSVVSGLLPIKRLQMSREWSERPLRRLTPTIGVDAALRDPSALAIPVPAGVHGAWTWWRRPEPGQPWEGTTVSADPPSAQPNRPVEAEDGYLRLTLFDDPPIGAFRWR
jgi:hypothetical protein